MAKRKVPLGTFTPIPESELETIGADITSDFIELMRATWQRYVTPRYESLLDADETDELDVTTPN